MPKITKKQLLEDIQREYETELRRPNAFLTGSHVYGTPTEESDVDLVVFMEEREAAKLWGLQDGEKNGGVIRFGKLNIIPCSSRERFNDWKRGTEELVKRSKELGRPMTRAEAVLMFNQLGVTGGSRGDA